MPTTWPPADWVFEIHDPVTWCRFKSCWITSQNRPLLWWRCTLSRDEARLTGMESDGVEWEEDHWRQCQCAGVIENPISNLLAEFYSHIMLSCLTLCSISSTSSLWPKSLVVEDESNQASECVMLMFSIPSRKQLCLIFLLSKLEHCNSLQASSLPSV